MPSTAYDCPSRQPRRSETRQSHERRVRDGYFETILAGRVLDINNGGDPVTPDCLTWCWVHGNAHTMPGVPNESFDWVYSSCCLQNLVDPWMALARWWELVKPGGYLLVVVPDGDLPTFGDGPLRHPTWSFHIQKWAGARGGVSLVELVAPLPHHRVRWLRAIEGDAEAPWEGMMPVTRGYLEALVQKGKNRVRPWLSDDVVPTPRDPEWEPRADYPPQPVDPAREVEPPAAEPAA